jgi:RimJ/RimL family protein N-acetyltransferase
MIIPTLETERLILREWRDEDFEGYKAYRADPICSKFIGVFDERSAWREMTYMAGHWLMRGFGNWSVVEKSSGKACGHCGPYYPHGWPEPEIGWGLYPGYWGKGYATEAATAALTYAYTKMNWKTAISLIASENAPSIALATRLGAVAESTMVYRDTPCTIYRHLTPSQFLKH